MGPQPSSRGNLNRFVHASTSVDRFCSASMGPQPSSRGNLNASLGSYERCLAALQWGRNLPVAEMTPSRPQPATSMETPASMGPQPSSRGNFAAFQVLANLNMCAGSASMGPQPSSRGNSAPATAIPQAQASRLQWGRNLPVAEMEAVMLLVVYSFCFNGAATFQSRKFSTSHSVSSRCFNGAATFQSRKSRPPPPLHPVAVTLLQWGRNLPVAEMQATPSASWCDARSVASMGPQPSSRGNIDGGEFEYAVATDYSFNGAATFQSRKSSRELRSTTTFGPSLGLQWGRNLPVAEMSLSRCGTFRSRRRASELQWGRNLPVAEIRGAREASPRAIKLPLQWGRNLPVAEIGRHSSTLRT